MERKCVKCGKPVGFLAALSRSTTGQGLLCPECAAAERQTQRERQRIDAEETKAAIVAVEEKRRSTVDEIQTSKQLGPDAEEWLKSLDGRKARAVYNAAYDAFNVDSHLDMREVETLRKIQSVAGLSDEEVRYDDRVFPYVFGATIEAEGKLPVLRLQPENLGSLLLKRNETVHFARPAKLKEMKVVRVGYEGGSHGVSFRIAKGVHYRIGASQGHLVKDEHYVVTTAGAIIITNQRVLLHPSPGNKPVSIDLKKVLSYSCYENGLLIFKEGREKGFLFVLDKPIYNEIAGMCLGFLTANN